MIYSPGPLYYLQSHHPGPGVQEAPIPSMLIRIARHHSFALAPCLVATSLFLASCDTLRSAVGLPEQAEERPAAPAPKPLPPKPKPTIPPPAAPAPPTPPPAPEVQAPQEQSVKVALLLPLSGRLATLGRGMADAAQMAMHDLADRRFELLPIDDKGTSGGSADAARQAIAAGAQLILGPLLAPSVRAVAPVAASAGIPVVAFSSDRKVAEPGVHVIGFMPEAEVQRVVEYAATAGLGRFAALAPDNPYGTAVADALRRTAAASGVSVVRVDLYDPKTQDFTPVVRRLLGISEPPPAAQEALAAAPGAGAPPQGAPLVVTPAPPPPSPAAPFPAAPSPAPPNFDALLLAEGGTQLRGLASALSTVGVRTPLVQLLGTGKWDEPGIGAERALDGAWFAAPAPSYRDEFEARYRRVFGQAPPRLATLAYDATALAAVLARGSAAQPFADPLLTDPNGFFGRDGLFRLTDDGVAERRLAILRVDRSGVTVISEPARSFAAGS